MPNIFETTGDVAREVASQGVNGRPLLELQLKMGIYGGHSAEIARQWLVEDDARIADEKAKERERWEREVATRTIRAAETQAHHARNATRIALGALCVSILGLVVAIVALIK